MSLKVRSGLRAPAPIDRPGIGSEADQYARLAHVAERHGLQRGKCSSCSGSGSLGVANGQEIECGACAGWGFLFVAGNMDPCGPGCPLLQLRPS